jgi:hypothetical protein
MSAVPAGLWEDLRQYRRNPRTSWGTGDILWGSEGTPGEGQKFGSYSDNFGSLFVFLQESGGPATLSGGPAGTPHRNIIFCLNMGLWTIILLTPPGTHRISPTSPAAPDPVPDTRKTP